VSINGDVELIALFRAARAIEAGEAVTLGDISGIEGLRPANIDANAGWLALAKIGNEIIVDFDFRRNRQTAALLVSLAVEFAEAATSSFDRGHLGPAIENAFAAVELAVKAQMFLLQDNPTQAHLERVAWWSQWEKLGNAPSGAAQVLQQLYGERGASRYGDRPISMAPDDVRAALEGVAGIIGLARARNAERETPT
jgi:HEPN domain-containing protein